MSSRTLALISDCGKCGTKINKTFSRVAYEKGLVLVRCDGCGVRHLIADNIGWFQHVPGKNLDDYYPGRVVKGKMSPGSLSEDGKIDVEIDIDGNVSHGLTKEELNELLLKATKRKD